MLSKFPNKTLKVGAKVSLSPKSEFASDWERSSNPVGIVGVVVEPNSPICFDGGEFGIQVSWSNGT